MSYEAVLEHGIKFLSNTHKAQFINALDINRRYEVSTGDIDMEYGVAFYLLTSSADVWSKCRNYTRGGIDFETILKRGKFSTGEYLVVRLAQDLFGRGTGKGISAYDMVYSLDNNNFNLCLDAIRLCKKGSLNIGMLDD